jgi:hypothetical protein
MRSMRAHSIYAQPHESLTGELILLGPEVGQSTAAHYYETFATGL